MDAPLTQTPSNFGYRSCLDAVANTFIRILVTGNCRYLKYSCALNSGQGASNSGYWPEYRYAMARIMLQWPEFGLFELLTRLHFPQKFEAFEEICLVKTNHEYFP